MEEQAKMKSTKARLHRGGYDILALQNLLGGVVSPGNHGQPPSTYAMRYKSIHNGISIVCSSAFSTFIKFQADFNTNNVLVTPLFVGVC